MPWKLYIHPSSTSKNHQPRWKQCFLAWKVKTAKFSSSGRAPFAATFEWVPLVQIRCKMAHWKAWSVYFPSQVDFRNLVLIWPLKNHFSQGHFLQLKKWAESQFLGVFWAFGGSKLKIKLPPSTGNFYFCIPFPKMPSLQNSEQPFKMISPGVRPNRGQNL